MLCEGKFSGQQKHPTQFWGSCADQCMHRACPDLDLCKSCEARNLHPKNHPMLTANNSTEGATKKFPIWDVFKELRIGWPILNRFDVPILSKVPSNYINPWTLDGLAGVDRLWQLQLRPDFCSVGVRIQHIISTDLYIICFTHIRLLSCYLWTSDIFAWTSRHEWRR